MIVTTQIHPPIPNRDFDWQATFADWEPGDLAGIGATEAAAVRDLQEQADEYQREQMESAASEAAETAAFRSYK